MPYLLSISDKDVFPNKQPKAVEQWEDRPTVKMVVQNKEGKIAFYNFYNTAFNIIRNKTIFEETKKHIIKY